MSLIEPSLTVGLLPPAGGTDVSNRNSDFETGRDETKVLQFARAISRMA